MSYSLPSLLKPSPPWYLPYGAPFLSADDLTSHSSEKNRSLQRGTYSLSYHWIYKLPSSILFSVFSTIIVSLLLIKTNPSPHALNPTPFYLFKDFISLLHLESLLYWIIPLYANKLLFPLFKKQSKQTKKNKTPLTPYILFQLSPFSFTSNLSTTAVYTHTSHSPLHLF